MDGFLKKHITTITLLGGLVAYILTGNDWLNAYLPLQGKTLIVFMLVLIVILVEIYACDRYADNDRFNQLTELIKETAKTQEEGAIRHRINSIFQNFIASDDDYITNDFTIRQLADLQDRLTEHRINSYSQGQMTYLRDRINIDHQRREGD